MYCFEYLDRSFIRKVLGLHDIVSFLFFANLFNSTFCLAMVLGRVKR